MLSIISLLIQVRTVLPACSERIPRLSTLIFTGYQRSGQHLKAKLNEAVIAAKKRRAGTLFSDATRVLMLIFVVCRADIKRPTKFHFETDETWQLLEQFAAQVCSGCLSFDALC